MGILKATPLVKSILGNDQANLLLNGPLVKVELSAPMLPQDGKIRGKVIPGYALIDTGSYNTVIDIEVAKRLNLIATGTALSQGVFGPPQQVCEYAVDWRLVETSTKFDTIPVTEAPLVENVDGVIMLLGRNILVGCELIYDGTNGTFSLSW